MKKTVFVSPVAPSLPPLSPQARLEQMADDALAGRSTGNTALDAALQALVAELHYQFARQAWPA